MNRENLWRVLALRTDYPAGQCAAWMDSADRVCRKPETADTPRLCARHAKVAAARVEKATAKASTRTMSAERETMITERLERNLERLTRTPAEADRAAACAPLRGRIMTDAQLDRWRALTNTQSALEGRIALDLARLRDGRG